MAHLSKRNLFAYLKKFVTRVNIFFKTFFIHINLLLFVIIITGLHRKERDGYKLQGFD